MGKPTGFLEYTRCANPAEEPLSRIRHWNEFHPALPREQRMEQGARCMECGVPFCQSGVALLGGAVTGCPLHNLIPEWNDLVYTGNFNHALQRLHKTNNFPEFTGRVCPALCEAACTCGLNGDPVTIKENELGIVEDCFAAGLITAHPPKVRTGKKVAVVGSGPSGLAAADQLNLRGHSVTVFEREDRVGGLLMYGIPNMKLEKDIVGRRVRLMAEEGIEFLTGVDVGKDIEAQALLRDYDAVILCCGAKKPRDLSVKNRDVKGVHFAVDFLAATTKSLLDSNLKDGRYIGAKGKHVVIVGGGDTGNDCVGTSIRHGCKSVVQIEMMPKLPDARAESNPWPQWPFVCKTDYGQEEAIALFGADPRVYQTTVKELVADAKGNIKSVVTVALQREQKDGRTVMTECSGTEKTLPCDLLLIAAGFLGPEDYLPELFGLARDARSNVKTSPDGYRVGAQNLFAAGDMRRGQSLVVWAIAEGRAAAREVDEYLMGYTNL
ncbi:MAG TPA: glutamate synthase subunit beta [Pseudoflavonifractor sp.]|nr:glutamate synthase subunit beta [Pseudoflavonifractor sp.]